MRIGRKFWPAIATAMAATIALTGCFAGGSTQGAGEEPVSGGVLRYVAEQEPEDWDLSHDWPATLVVLSSNVYDRLVRLDTDGTFHPWLASSWDVAPDGKRIRINLRRDVKFHDGTVFDANAVKANVDRWIADPNSSNAQDISLDSVTVVDPYTADFNLTAPSPGALQLISAATWSIVSPKSLAENGTQISAGAGQVGTGPFKVASYSRGDSLVLERNPDYAWAPETAERQGPAHLDRVEVTFLPEAAARIGALQSGQADFVAGVPAISIPQIEADAALTVRQGVATGAPYSLSLNTEQFPTDDVNVRKAIRSSLDVQGLLDSLYFGRFEQAWSALAPNTPPVGAYNDSLVGGWEPDLDEAARLLDAAGWSTKDADGIRTKDGRKLELRWVLNAAKLKDQRDVLAQGIQAELRKAGIDAKIDLADSGTFTERVKAGDYNIAEGSWQYAEANILRTAFHSVRLERTNYARIDERDVDAQIDVILQDNDQTARAEAARAVQQRAFDEVWTIPLYAPVTFVATKNTVGGVSFDIAGWHDSLYDVWIND